MKKSIPLLFTFLSLSGLFMYLLYSLIGQAAWQNSSLTAWLWLFFCVITGSLLLLLAYYKLLSLINWRFYPAGRFALSCLSVWGLILLSLLLFSYRFDFWSGSAGFYPSDSVEIFRLKGAVIGLLLSILFTLIDFSWFNYYRYAAETLGNLQAERRQKELQFEVLRSQLTPHYLFNSLNTASNLLSSQPTQAELFIRRLALNFKFLLKQSAKPFNSLKEELQIVDNFFQLMQVRFGERIILQKDIPEACLHRLLPTLSLQQLVENAIKHNVASEQQAVRIRIAASPEGVIVHNNLTLKPEQIHSGGIGLRNLRERYEHLSRKQLTIYQSHDRYEVQLPYVEKVGKEVYA